MPNWMQVSALRKPSSLALWVLSSLGSKNPGPRTLLPQDLETWPPDLILTLWHILNLLGIQHQLCGAVPVLPPCLGWHFSLPHPRRGWPGQVHSLVDLLAPGPDQVSHSSLSSPPFCPLLPSALSLCLCLVSPLSLLRFCLYILAFSIHVCPLRPPGTKLWAVPWDLSNPEPALEKLPVLGEGKGDRCNFNMV